MNQQNLNLFYSKDINVENAYIITVKNNESSENYSKRCQQSCLNVGMPFQVWDAFDGTQPGEIIVPEHSKNSDFIRMLKVTDHFLTRGEVACALSHISLWILCAKIDKPIVILEHDTIMLKKFTHMENFNSIVYLGGEEWAELGWKIYSTPPHGTQGPNHMFICRAHAYAIDPTMAKNLLSHVLKMGICNPLDLMLRADLFNITHQGLYAYDKIIKSDTTIQSRSSETRTSYRNDNLEK